ncbi:hypothetical protein AAFF_G00382790 [Aldrovandia affinis]|uniref:T-complex protein 11-like protein 1 n=1 Tax=Aldrovandia affinis TaxID=143900 RepID=A0AAD7T965_9TELE|nr:hypothetical protein AAFF_G00382790 [Aldrovandia affinis]
MPKEDPGKPPCGEEEGRSDPAESPEPSEQSLSKRIRQSTPNPGRGNTPQSSPPRFVSVEELMETAKGVTNMALAHEIVVNGGFQVTPSQPPEGSLEKRVKDIMHKAFWDCLEAQLGEDPPLYGHAISLLGEIKETLLSFLLPGHGRLRHQIEEVLDLDLIQQQAENGALDISKLASFIIDMMGMLCAPSRDEEIQKLRDITTIVPLFKAIFLVMDMMKIDMANFAVSSIRPHLMQQSVEYERKKFQEFLDKQPNAMDFTQKWLQDTANALLNGDWEGGASSAGASAPIPSMLHPLITHNHAYLRLLTWDHGSCPFPETLLMDQKRFQEMQWDLDELTVAAAVLLIVYNNAGAAISGLPGLMERLKSTVRLLLAEIQSPSFNVDEAFATIAEQMCMEVGGSLAQHGFSPFSADRLSALKGQIIAVKLPDNSIRKLIDSRIQTFLLGFLESSQRRCAATLPGGLAPIQKELEEIAIKFGRLVNYNKLVFAPHYQRILQDVLREGGCPAPGSTPAGEIDS